MTRAVAAFVLLAFIVGPASADTDDRSPRSSAEAIDLLAQAARAVHHETYRGVLVYVRGGDLDTLRIIHRKTDGVEQERLISLTGPPREVIRRGGVITSILPDSELVLVSRRDSKTLLGNVAGFSADRMHKYYTVTENGRRRLAERVGRLIEIEPKDHYRYGYRMLVDEDTHLPLKLDLISDDDVVEQLMFTQIDFPGAIEDSEFEPGYDIDGFRVVKHRAVAMQDRPVPDSSWQPTELPPGFELAEDGVRRVTEDGYVRQMLFTDGVATVSAFIAPVGLRKPLDGATTMGAVNAFGHVADDTQITVVGEVPAVTVEHIARHIVREAAADHDTGS